jgi:HAD superfamily hydrolase (TIGR01509 family)
MMSTAAPSLPRMPAAVVFDMDGLLFDTEKLYRAALFSAASAAGYGMTEALSASTIGTIWPQTRQRLLDHYGPDFQPDVFREHWLAHLDALLPDLAMKPGVVELLDALDSWGIPRAIATSSRRENVDHHLAAHALVHRFDHVVAYGDYAAGKPAPDPFLTAATRLGVPAGLCLALEDSHHGVRSAAGAGMMTIMVPDLLPPTPQIAALCVAVAPDLHHVRAVIRATLDER